MRPEQLIDAVEYTTLVLARHVDRDWSVRAGTLDWDVRFTVAHIAGGIRDENATRRQREMTTVFRS